MAGCRDDGRTQPYRAGDAVPQRLSRIDKQRDAMFLGDSCDLGYRL